MYNKFLRKTAADYKGDRISRQYIDHLLLPTNYSDGADLQPPAKPVLPQPYPLGYPPKPYSHILWGSRPRYNYRPVPSRSDALRSLYPSSQLLQMRQGY